MPLNFPGWERSYPRKSLNAWAQKSAPGVKSADRDALGSDVLRISARAVGRPQGSGRKYGRNAVVSLRVLAIAAPQFQSGGVGDLGISSADPASLFNGCRWAAYLAQQKIGPWGESNWAGTRAARRPAVLLMNSLDDSLPVLHERLETIRPNLVLIGAMSVCLPGAVAVARYVRALLGDDVCIVLGGRHARSE